MAAGSEVPLRAESIVGGRYQLLGLLGQGGMGTVHRAFDRELDEVVALKIMRADSSFRPDQGLDRFKAEVRSARRINSPHVARTFEYGHDGNLAWIAMELIEGSTLADWMAQRKHVDTAEMAKIGRCIALGLAAAHQCEVVHRDLKPGNVLMGEDRVAICDFGLARMDWRAQQTGASVGTPAYMAPEQVNGGPVTPQTDLFAFGVLLFELACKDLPWRADNAVALALARVHRPASDPRILRPDLPERLVRLINQCLQADAARRPANAQWVADELAAVFGLPVSSVSQLPAPNRSTLLAPNLPPRLAVLPVQWAGAPADEWVAAGLADDLVGVLGRHNGVRVLASRVTQPFGADSRSPAEIGAQLGATLVVHGTARRIGKISRFNFSLARVADGETLWSDRFDVRDRELLRLPDVVAADLIAALSGVPKPAGVLSTASDPQVVRAYLLAKRQCEQAVEHYDPAALREALAIYKQLTAAAPNDALILAGRAVALQRQVVVLDSAPPEALQEAELAAKCAVEAAPMAGEAWLARGSVAMWQGDAPAAAKYLRRSIGCQPSAPEPRVAAATLLMDAGQFSFAEQQLEVAFAMGGEPGMTIGEILRCAVLQGNRDKQQRWRNTARELGLSPIRGWVTMSEAARAVGDLDLAGELDQEWRGATNFPARLTPLRDLTAALLGRIPASTALLSLRQWTEAPNLPRRNATKIFGMELQLRAPKLEDAALLAELGQIVDQGLAELVWLERVPCLQRVRHTDSFARMHELVAARAQAVTDAMRSDWSAPSLAKAR